MAGFANVDQAIATLAANVDPKRLAGMKATVLFDLSGEGGRQYTAQIDNGRFSLVEKDAPAPDVTIRMKSADFLAMTNGTLNPVAAFMQGRIRVEGDMALAMQLQALFT